MRVGVEAETEAVAVAVEEAGVRVGVQSRKLGERATVTGDWAMPEEAMVEADGAAAAV